MNSTDKQTIKANFLYLVQDLVKTALNSGVVVTVDTKPCVPLAMGNYNLEVSVRDTRDNSEPKVINSLGTRIVCAAIQINNTVIPSIRHYDSIAHSLINKTIGEEYDQKLVVQGFIDNKGHFLTREQAWVVANAAGQILRRVGGDHVNGGRLFSENLY